MLAVSLVVSFLLPAIVVALPGIARANGKSHSQAALASNALSEILTRGAPILGTLSMNLNYHSQLTCHLH
jgi:hypothetical protein